MPKPFVLPPDEYDRPKVVQSGLRTKPPVGKVVRIFCFVQKPIDFADDLDDGSAVLKLEHWRSQLGDKE